VTTLLCGARFAVAGSLAGFVVDFLPAEPTTTKLSASTVMCGAIATLIAALSVYVVTVIVIEVL
jgi:hypothetical protein